MLIWSRKRVQRFALDESGVIMTEFLIVLPLLTWSIMALVVWWDTWRTINEGQKAAYAIADLISRQSEINMNYVNGMETVMEGLMGRPNVISMRITSVQWNYDPITGEGDYTVIFSRSPNGKKNPLSYADVNGATADLIPVMNPGETTVILETWTAYQPSLDVGIPATGIRNFIVTKPRYFLKVCLSESMATCPVEVS
ncbi:TadE/TadG family type IV pilus assembly protein [Pseudogemmobacter bohemicus]|uniref:TadE/TadG family type IV pilus assembly protein n=1 Tax=Pseudogemmobacter bohemicus TaxID=2250708 RepID=UPI000DD4199A|nr:hypothetical protein [Pseudogemmobacter bohemicus]